jgi:site-specific DNA-methyltransferase (adenine-specific)
VGDVRLILGDCLDVLKSMDAGSVDAVVTDPPYSAKTHAGARSRVITGRSALTEYAGATPLVSYAPLSMDDYLAAAKECVRVARRWVVMTCDWRHAAAAEAELPVVRLGVWVKPDAAPQFSGDRPACGWEAVLILHRPGRKRWNGGGLPAVWRCGIQRKGVHPSQKPLPLLRQWIEQFTDEDETILDPFMGSGTTGVACVQTGRRFVGVEIDPAYFAIAERRVAEAQAACPLFAESSP